MSFPIQTSASGLAGTITEEFADVDGCRVRFLAGGTGSPLILIHGLLGYSFSWRFNLATLAQRATVYALDLPGAGFSGRSRKRSAGVRPAAEQVLRLAQVIGIRSAALLGSSFGGAVAMMAATLAGQNDLAIDRLVLVSPVNPWSSQGRFLTSMLGSRVGAACFRPLAPRLGPMHGLFLKRMYGDPRRIAPGTLEGYRKPLSIPGTLDHLLGRVQNWGRDSKELEIAIARLPRIPTLLVWGSRDRAVYPASALELLKRIPNAELVTIPGAGHLPYEENPEEFNRAVLQFFDSASTARAVLI